MYIANEEELLTRFYYAKKSCIGEFSSDIANDMRELAAAIKLYADTREFSIDFIDIGPWEEEDEELGI